MRSIQKDDEFLNRNQSLEKEIKEKMKNYLDSKMEDKFLEVNHKVEKLEKDLSHTLHTFAGHEGQRRAAPTP